MAGRLVAIGFQNFRTFRDYTSFYIGPITIFCGPNNSGKSSAIKGLSLLAENIKKNKLTRLDFHSRNHNLGSFDQVRNNKSEDEHIVFSFHFASKYLFLNTIDLSNMLIQYIYKKNDEYGGLYNFSIRTTDETLNRLVFVLGIQPAANAEINILLNIKYIIDYLQREIKQLEQQKKHHKDGIFQFQLPSGEAIKFPRTLFLNVVIDEKFKSINSDIVSEELVTKALNLGEPNKKVYRFIEILNEYILKALGTKVWNKEQWNSPYSLWNFDNFDSASYLDIIDRYFSNDDPNQQPFYQKLKDIKWGQKIRTGLTEENSLKFEIKNFKDIDKYQEFFDRISDKKIFEVIKPEFIEFFRKVIQPLTMDLFALNLGQLNINYLKSNRGVPERVYLDSEESLLNKLAVEYYDKRKKLPHRVKIFFTKWLKRFGIGDLIQVHRIPMTASRVYIKRGNKKIELADLGYGSTQFLPLLIVVVLKFDVIQKGTNRVLNDWSSNNLLLIEEPEANLHPKLQSLLADFFVDCLKTFNIKLILETHSEYLIRKIQYLTARKELDKNDSIIYYFNELTDDNAHMDSNVKEIRINDDGSLTDDFGPGFFDEATTLKLDLLKLKHLQKN